MINRTAIQQWSNHAPWIDNAQIEQDLIICRALVSIFSDEFLASQLAFRGGTALHKLYLSPQPRYSEDIDLVQIAPGPIKPIMYRLGEVLDWLPDRVTNQKRYNNTMLFRMESEIPPTIQIRLKVEINCFEHFNVLGLTKASVFLMTTGSLSKSLISAIHEYVVPRSIPNTSFGIFQFYLKLQIAKFVF